MSIDPARIQVIACDIFGTTVDWRTGVADQVARIAQTRDVDLDAGAFADHWRDLYLPSMRRVNNGDQPWVNLDILHRRSLEEVLHEYGLDGRFDDTDRAAMVAAWHRLPPWPDTLSGLARLRNHRPVVALSNGGFRLLTNLVHHARLPLDGVLSAELARTYKPGSGAYLKAAELLDVPPGNILMVAAHVWDTTGAAEAGFATAFLHRPDEKGPQRTADRPDDATADIYATDFYDLAAQLDF
jgi:2-haloacid dehalogenase